MTTCDLTKNDTLKFIFCPKIGTPKMTHPVLAYGSSPPPGIYALVNIAHDDPLFSYLCHPSSRSLYLVGVCTSTANSSIFPQMEYHNTMANI